MDIESKMLLAIAGENVGAAQSNQPPSLDEMIKYINKHINSLSLNDRKSVGYVLVQHGKQHCLHQCEEGTIIHLDPLPRDIIEKMYNVVMDKKDKNTRLY